MHHLVERNELFRFSGRFGGETKYFGLFKEITMFSILHLQNNKRKVTFAQPSKPLFECNKFHI